MLKSSLLQKRCNERYIRNNEKKKNTKKKEYSCAPEYRRFFDFISGDFTLKPNPTSRFVRRNTQRHGGFLYFFLHY